MRGLQQIYQYTAQSKTERPQADVTFSGWSYGLNTTARDYQIEMNELAAAVNFKITDLGGKWGPRAGISRQTTTAMGAGGKAHKFIPIAGTVYDLMVDADKKLYYNNSGVATRIGGTRLLSSTSVYMFAYKGVALICDGSYLKYCDGTGATGLKITYDDGTGPSGYQFNHLTDTSDTSLPLGDGTNTRVSQKFTAQAWDSGFTIPPTRLSVNLSVTGSPTGSIVMKIRAVSDDSVLASKTIVSDVTEISTEDTYYATFAATDITTELSPSTDYYASLEYSAGDVSNYINVHCNNCSTGGLAFYYDGSYNADTAKNLIAGLRPGRPPKCTGGEVYGQRPWVIGSPDAPGGAYTGNFTYLDWSTTSYGGFVSVADDDANTFEVGAIKTIYGQLYFFGTNKLPYIAELSGTTFDDFEINPTYQRQWTTQKLLVDAPNDLWFANSSGVSSLAGVQEFGDLRTEKYSDSVKDRFVDYFDKVTAISGYDPTDGQYMVQMPDYHRLLIFCIGAPAVIGDTETKRRIPACEYEFCTGFLSDTDVFSSYDSGSGTNERYFKDVAGNDPGFTGAPDFLIMDGKVLTRGTVGSLADHEWDYGDNDTLGYSTIYYRDNSGDLSTTGLELRAVMIPQSIAEYNGEIYYLFSDGHEYKIDKSEYKDLGLNQLFYDFRCKYVSGRFSSLNLIKQQLDFEGEYGGRFDLEIYTDGEHLTPTATYRYYIVPDDRLRLIDFTAVDLIDAVFPMDPDKEPVWRDMELNASLFQARITNLVLSGGPIYANGISFLMRKLEV